MGFKVDLTGQRFGRWTVLGFDCNKNKKKLLEM